MMLTHGKAYMVKYPDHKVIKCVYVDKSQCPDIEAFRNHALQDAEIPEGKGFFLSKNKEGNYFVLKVRVSK